MNVGFIGLGTMGGAMATNLLKGGHTVKGFDLSQTALDKFQQAGGTSVSTFTEAGNDVEVVFTMLPNSPHVENVVNGGLADVMPKGSLYVDCSTILPEATERVGRVLRSKGIRVMDAPVGRTGAEALLGKLLFMVGGEKADLDFITPCLECMGSDIVYCGPFGSGIATKIINNYMSITLNVLTAEALTLAERLGLNRDTLIEVLSGTPAGRGHFKTTYANKVLKGDVSPAFMLDLANKDLGLALEVAASQNVPLFTGAGARQAYSLARAQGHGHEDWTAILLAIRQMAQGKV